jgi:hypothetical protein
MEIAQDTTGLTPQFATRPINTTIAYARKEP